MAIIDDFSFDTDNRVIRHGSGSVVYSVNQLYSLVQDTFDEISNLSFTVPMSAQTPTEYTLQASWFMPDELFKYLKGGAVKTEGLDASTSVTGVYVINHTTTGYFNCVPTDIGRVVSAGGTSGRLLDYNNTLRKWWVRRYIGTSWVGVASVVGGSGSGAIATVSTGENLYANIYTLGLLEPTTTNTLYVQQINPELTNNQIVQYWPTGHIDILVKVKESSTPVDAGVLKVFCREYTDLYSHFAVDVSSGGRNPIPLGTADDSNNQTAPATVQTWNDVTITFGAITRDLGDGNGPQPYGVEVDCGSRVSVQQVYERLKLVSSRNSGVGLSGALGQFYRSANNSYVENVPAPFGSFAGGKFFGARGVFLKNVPASDINNVEFLDSNNTKRKYPFTSSGSFLVNSVLQNDPNAFYTVFFTTNPSGNYGTNDAVIVNSSVGVPLTGKVNGSASIPWSFDYTFNTQGGRTPNTDATITIFAIGKATGYYTTVNTTITQATGQNFTLAVTPEQNYAN